VGVRHGDHCAERDLWIRLIRKVQQGAGFQVQSSDEEEQTRKRQEEKARKQLPTGKSAEAYKAVMRARYDLQVAENEVQRLEKLQSSDPSEAHTSQLQAARSALRHAAETVSTAESAVDEAAPESMAPPVSVASPPGKAPAGGAGAGASVPKIDTSGKGKRAPPGKEARPARDEHSAESGGNDDDDDDTSSAESANGAMSARSGDGALLTARGAHDDAPMSPKANASATKDAGASVEGAGSAPATTTGAVASATTSTTTASTTTSSAATDAKSSEPPTTASIVSLLRKATNEGQMKRRLEASKSVGNDVGGGWIEQVEVDGHMVTLVKGNACWGGGVEEGRGGEHCMTTRVTQAR
jgi:hypothetical protein